MTRLTCSLLLCAVLVACTGSVVPCSSRPTDPLCQDVDAGGDGGTRDADMDTGPMRDMGVDSSADAHVPCNGACGGATPRCLPTTETCVACLGPSDCTAGTAHVCDTAGDHTCVACVAETDCTGGTHCDTAARQCVACLMNDQCPTAAAARCDTGTHMCTTCTGNPDCAHLTGTGVCNASGACVQCTATDLGACTSGICLTSTSTCAPTGGATPTCGACTHDTDCGAGQLCVATSYASMPVGTFCAWRQDAAGSGAPNGNCASVAPYVSATATTSVDGVAASTCLLRVSDCPALADFATGGTGAGGQCTGPTTGTSADPSCGAPGIADGFCRLDTSSNHYCTVECTTTSDCPCRGGACASHYTCTGGFCSLN